jgi:DNA-binding response OmpR family regulator
LRTGAEHPAPHILPREGRGGRADHEAKIWIAEQARAGRRSRPQVPVLFVSPFQKDRAALSAILKEPEFRLFLARDVRQAAAVLRKVNVSVIVAECDLHGLRWQDMWTALQGVAERPLPRLIVAASRADERLWNEVFDSGADDVLDKPFESEEVVCAVTDAWEHWRREAEAATGA